MGNKYKALALVIILVMAFTIVAIASSSVSVRTVTIGVDGMTCKLCAAALEPQLKATRGVLDARVSFKNKNAWIKYNDKLVTIAKLRKAIDDSGFKAR